MAVYFSATCPVYIAPAMDLDMWRHAAIQHNISRLKQYGNRIIPPGYGELASGLTGEGRLAEPEEIVAFIGQDIKEINGAPGSASTGVTTGGPAGTLNGKQEMVTAGDRKSGEKGKGGYERGKIGG